MSLCHSHSRIVPAGAAIHFFQPFEGEKEDRIKDDIPSSGSDPEWSQTLLRWRLGADEHFVGLGGGG